MYSSTLPSTSALDGGGWSTPRPGRFTLGKDPVHIVKEAGWAPGPVCTDAENLASTGIRSPDRPACSESLYRLGYPGPRLVSIVSRLRVERPWVRIPSFFASLSWFNPYPANVENMASSYQC